MSNALTLSHFSMPSAAGSIEAYIQAANRVPMLAEGEEFDLARRFRDDNDLDAARRLVLSHLRLVIAVAHGYLGYGPPHADLIQEGNIGLMKAVKRFDPDRGVRLVSFAMHWIKAEELRRFLPLTRTELPGPASQACDWSAASSLPWMPPKPPLLMTRT